MPVSTRRSTFGAVATADSSAEAVTAILNEEAGSKPNTPSQKRKRQSNVQDTPNERVARVEIPIHVVGTGPRQSGRLKARASLSVPTLAARGDPFSFPGDHEAGRGQGSQVEPRKKLRQLNKAKQPEESPFKGRGVLETRSTARVNLDDSPMRRPVRDLSKLKKSIQNPRRAAAAPRSTQTLPQTAANVPFQGENILDVAFENDEILPLISPAVDVESVPPVQTANESLETSAGVPDDGHLEDDTNVPAEAPAGQNEQSIAPNLSSQPTQQRPNEVLPTAPQNDSQEDQEQPPRDNSDEANPVPTQPTSTALRPETEAHRRATEQSEAEKEAERQERIKEALRGIEEAVEVEGCRELWQEALVGGVELSENRPSNEPVSTLGKEAVRALKHMITEYRQIARHPPPRPESDQVLQENHRILKDICRRLNDMRDRRDLYYDRERSRTVRDIYGHLIPRSLRLDRAALKALCRDGQLSIDAFERMYGMLQITNQLLEAGTKWEPRPDLENKMKSLVRNEIGPKIAQIMGRYKQRFEQAIFDTRRQKHLEKLKARQSEDMAKLLALAQQRRAEKVARLHATLQETTLPSRSVPSSPPVYDIDDLDVDDHRARNGDDDRNGRAGSQPQHVRIANRPKPRRELTEDIPPPEPVPWSESELQLLIKGLSRYRTDSRFEDIFYDYGGPGNGLERFDMDQIIAQAKWLKASMADRLRQEKDNPKWDWLRSVPD